MGLNDSTPRHIPWGCVCVCFVRGAQMSDTEPRGKRTGTWSKIHVARKLGSGSMTAEQRKDVKKSFLALMLFSEFGGRLTLVAAEVGVSVDAVRKWMDADPEFREDIELRKDLIRENARAKLYHDAMEGDGTALKRYLDSEFPDEFGTQRVNMNHAGDAGVVGAGETLLEALAKFVDKGDEDKGEAEETEEEPTPKEPDE